MKSLDLQLEEREGERKRVREKERKGNRERESMRDMGKEKWHFEHI